MKTLTKAYWASEIQKLNQWVHAHPLKACAFSAGIAYLCAMTAVTFAEETYSQCRWISVGIMVITFAAFELVFHRDSKKLLAVLVVAAMLTAPTLRAEEPKPAPIVGRAVAVAVVVGGTWVVVKMIQFCKKHFGKDDKSTNSPPAEFVIAGDAPESGAVFSWTEEGYCTQARQTAPAVGLTLHITVPSASNATMTASGGAGDQYVQDLTGLQGELDAHGLPLFPTVEPTEFYEQNRHPCEPEQTRLSIDWPTKTIATGGPLLLTLEGSPDLSLWEPVLRLKVIPGARVEVQDATEDGMQFYRTTIEQPQ